MQHRRNSFEESFKDLRPSLEDSELANLIELNKKRKREERICILIWAAVTCIAISLLEYLPTWLN